MRSLDTIISNLRTKSKNPNLDTETAVVYVNDAIREVKSDYRITSAIRRESINVYPDVNEYSLPIPSGATETDFESITDLVEYFEGQQSMSRFNRDNPAAFARKYRNGYQDNYITPYIRNTQQMLLVDYQPQGIGSVLLNNCDDLTTNGTWVASGDASNLTADDITFVEGAGSLNFDITPSSLLAILTCTGMSPLDLTDYQNNASLFFYFDFPTSNSASHITQFELRWGNDASNYFSQTATLQQNGLAFQVGQDLIRVAWQAATQTGTVDITAIDYLQLRITLDASFVSTTDFRLDGIFCRQFKPMYFLYNSKYWIETTAGVLKEEFGSDTTDLFIGTGAECNLIETKALQNIFTLEIIDDLKAQQMEKKYQTILRNIKAQKPQQEKNESFIYAPKAFL